MIAWLRTHRHAASDARRRLVDGALGSVLTVLALGIVIALPAGGHWLITNVARVGSAVAESHEISVYLRDDVSQQDIKLVEQRILESRVAHWRFVGRDEALASLQALEGFADVIAGLKGNPLPDAFIVRPQTSDPDSLSRWAALARGWPQVAEVVLDSGWAQRYEAVLQAARRIVTALALALGLALVAVTFNTVRLQIASRQSEIEVALLLGATPGWIARPFLWLGVLEGLLGGILAVLLLFVAHALSGPVTAGLAALYGEWISLLAPELSLVFIVICGSTLIGWLGARLSVWALTRQVH